MKTKICIFGMFIFVLLFVGCAGPQHYHYVKVGKVEGDVWARNLGSRAQMIGGKNEIGIVLPVEGIPVQVDAQGDAPLQGTVLTINEVGGSLYFEEAFVGTQNIPIPEAFRALYKNSNGNPFGIELENGDGDSGDSN